MSLYQQLRKVGELLNLDCGDNSCVFAHPKGGMRTNGGCRCNLVAAVGKLQEDADKLAQALYYLEQEKE